ncbi:phytanoyl-CoA dioxygenase family protein [Phenylobacterium sp.]|uniref:phytanoyl-CoA dioxygenase family protein n=1 Tax=Phenylobacterium sp. TaxID=1871053 RepID=UPI0025F02EC9|nr:phytanoyl-CoA dioxygenase family protein [Phenylobacterium sp.]
MPATCTPLSPDEVRTFRDGGYLILRGAFAQEDALAMQDEWWAELAETHAILRDDPGTWRPIPGDLKRAKASPLQQAILTPRVRGVMDDLLGPGEWRRPADWGRTLATFPQPDARPERWDVPTGLWHWDSPTAWHRDALNGLFVVSFIGTVAPRGGGTLILSGSHRLLARQDAGLAAEVRDTNGRARRKLFEGSHPWLAALTGLAPSPADRIAAFMGAGAEIDGVPVRVVELTGEPGDMVVCHPTLVHCGAPNHGAQPRFMRIRQQLMTHEGRRRLSGAMHPR